jgi:DNA-binding Lrp family transcriptional regulator
MAEVRKAFEAYGRYDLVVFASSADYSAVRKLTSAINSLDGVRSTETLVEA